QVAAKLKIERGHFRIKSLREFGHALIRGFVSGSRATQVECDALKLGLIKRLMLGLELGKVFLHAAGELLLRACQWISAEVAIVHKVGGGADINRHRISTANHQLLIFTD